ncbi:14599_t:CDS:2, partial [Cetraspora pellucida]
MDKYEESLADLNKSLEIDPNNANTLSNRGSTYHDDIEIKSNNTETLNKSLEIGPSNVMINDPRKSMGTEQYDETILNNLRLCYKMDIDSDGSHDDDGNNKLHEDLTIDNLMSRYEELFLALNNLLKIEPNNVKALIKREIRGITHRKIFKYEESLADLNKALKELNEKQLEIKNEFLEADKIKDKRLTLLKNSSHQNTKYTSQLIGSMENLYINSYSGFE